MSSFDAQMQFILLYLLLPAVTLYFLTKIFKRQILNQFDKIHAWTLSKLAPRFHQKLEKLEEALFSELRELDNKLTRPLRLIEIGAGTGQNFQYFPPGTDVVCVDPNPHFRQYLDVSLSRQPHVNLVEFVVGRAEDMGRVESSSVDVVVSTLVLCTVDDVDAVLAEVLRVLKPGGKLFFLEHVAAENNTWLYKLQNFVCPLWKFMNANCHINRQIWNNINKCGFKDVKLKKVKAELGIIGFLLKPHIFGTATK